MKLDLTRHHLPAPQACTPWWAQRDNNALLTSSAMREEDPWLETFQMMCNLEKGSPRHALPQPRMHTRYPTITDVFCPKRRTLRTQRVEMQTRRYKRPSSADHTILFDGYNSAVNPYTPSPEVSGTEQLRVPGKPQDRSLQKRCSLLVVPQDVHSHGTMKLQKPRVQLNIASSSKQGMFPKQAAATKVLHRQSLAEFRPAPLLLVANSVDTDPVRRGSASSIGSPASPKSAGKALHRHTLPSRVVAIDRGVTALLGKRVDVSTGLERRLQLQAPPQPQLTPQPQPLQTSLLPRPLTPMPSSAIGGQRSKQQTHNPLLDRRVVARYYAERDEEKARLRNKRVSVFGGSEFIPLNRRAQSPRERDESAGAERRLPWIDRYPPQPLNEICALYEVLMVQGGHKDKLGLAGLTKVAGMGEDVKPQHRKNSFSEEEIAQVFSDCADTQTGDGDPAITLGAFVELVKHAFPDMEVERSTGGQKETPGMAAMVEKRREVLEAASARLTFTHASDMKDFMRFCQGSGASVVAIQLRQNPFTAIKQKQKATCTSLRDPPPPQPQTLDTAERDEPASNAPLPQWV